MDPLEFLDGERALYAAEWSDHNAALFERGGHYGWMADQIAGCQQVLEVGTGDGRSTAELLSRGHSVVSIDENVGCVMLARDRLSGAGFPITLHEREVERVAIGHQYAIRYADVGALAHSRPGSAVLLEGNILTDQGLCKALDRLANFDAVICWLIGIHRAVHLDAAHDGRPTEQAIYRLRVQNGVYVLADRILRPGGVLHIVDRTHREDDEARLEIEAAHQEQAGPTSMAVETVAYRDCRDAQTDRGIAMIAANPEKPAARPDFLVSVIARKPS